MNSQQLVVAALSIISLKLPSYASRMTHGRLQEGLLTDVGDPCRIASSSCIRCLQFKGPCMWCPAKFWNGNASYLGKRTGVCGSASEIQDVWCGGDGWSGATNDNGAVHVAPNVREAVWSCTEADFAEADTVELRSPEDDWKYGPLSTLFGATIMGMHEDDVRQLATLLDRIAMDLRRLRIFKDANPLLFEHHFHSGIGNVLKYAWKGAMAGFAFLDLGFGGILSSAIALAADGITDVTEEFVKDMSVSQKKLIENGASAGVQYFSDVTFGMLKECFLRIYNLPPESIAQLQERLVQSDGGTLAGKFHQAHNSITGRAIKFTTQAGLFAGGFFTAGVTWLIGAGLGLANYTAAGTAEEMSKQAAATKLKLLLGIARSRGESAWGDTGEACSITARTGTESPCTPVDPASSDGTPIPRFCSRVSMWDRHVDAIPTGEAAPEGRCFPTYLPQLPDGFPCHDHRSCKSSYCHYEPRLQFFISDHVRQYCEPGTKHCYESVLQLSSLSKVVPRPASEIEFERLQNTLLGFVGKYDSYEGVEFATTGTCATACPLSEIGSGSCSHTGHLGNFGVRKARTNGVNDKFTSQEHLPSKGYLLSPVIFEKIGDGMCINHDGELPVVEMNISTTDPLRECAGHCVDLGLSAFTIDHVNGVSKCKLHTGRPGTVKKTTGGFAECYDTELPWPLDAYQPWNRIWRNYRAEIRQVLGKLHFDGESTLPKIRHAYQNYCRNSQPGQAIPVLMEGCMDPSEWDATMALRALVYMSPLSAKQLHTLYTQIFN